MSSPPFAPNCCTDCTETNSALESDSMGKAIVEASIEFAADYCTLYRTTPCLTRPCVRRILNLELNVREWRIQELQSSMPHRLACCILLDAYKSPDPSRRCWFTTCLLGTLGNVKDVSASTNDYTRCFIDWCTYLDQTPGHECLCEQCQSDIPKTLGPSHVMVHTQHQEISAVSNLCDESKGHECLCEQGNLDTPKTCGPSHVTVQIQRQKACNVSDLGDGTTDYEGLDKQCNPDTPKTCGPPHVTVQIQQDACAVSDLSCLDTSSTQYRWTWVLLLLYSLIFMLAIAVYTWYICQRQEMYIEFQQTPICKQYLVDWL